jgi:hypothetical protein
MSTTWMSNRNIPNPQGAAASLAGCRIACSWPYNNGATARERRDLQLGILSVRETFLCFKILIMTCFTGSVNSKRHFQANECTVQHIRHFSSHVPIAIAKPILLLTWIDLP